jgi:hypothetical protein
LKYQRVKKKSTQRPLLIIENGKAHDKTGASFFEGCGGSLKGCPGGNDIVKEQDPLWNRAGTAYTALKVAQPVFPVKLFLTPGREPLEAGIYIKIPDSPSEPKAFKALKAAA